MRSELFNDLEIIIERTPEEWAALAKKIKSQPVSKPELNLFDVKGALSSIAKAPYRAASSGLEKGASGLAKKIGLSPETAGKIGDIAGSPEGVGVAAAGATLAIYAGYKLYKRYMTKMGKECAGHQQPKVCKLQFQIRAKKAQVQKMLETKEHSCKTTNCYRKVDLHVRKLKVEIDNLQSRLNKIPPPKRPEGERREDEIFKGHRPAVK